MPVGIIGLGRLGGALARGLGRVPGAEVYAYSRTATTAARVVADAPGVRLLESATEIFERCDVVFVWMYAADAREVLAANAELIARRQPFLVSSTPDAGFGAFSPRWAETLPNVNLSTGLGVTLLTWGGQPSDEDRERVLAPLLACGEVYEGTAEEVAAWCALSSNGPALYARALECWADTVADRNGLDRELCRDMVRRTVVGTIALQEDDGIDASEVIRRVAHPGGSTERGLRVMDASIEELSAGVLRALIGS
jgi:pyrroline-5-carboxylate reductase